MSRVTLTEAKRALRLFRSEWAPKDLQRQNALKWLAATRALGEKWLLANPQQRSEARK
jgi:hypothetical protein